MRRMLLILGLATALLSAGCGQRTHLRTAPLLPSSLESVGLHLAAAPDTVGDWNGFTSGIHREGRVLISGQPSRVAMLEMPSRGVTAVINLRTPAEVGNRDRVPFDEPALADSLGLVYVSIPLGGDEHPYTPAAVESFAAVVAAHPGTILVHCTVGWRASHMWAAYLVRHHGMDVSEAYARGEAMGIGKMAFAELIGRDVKVELKD